MTIRCAICDQPTTHGSANPWRPFCSERCKLLDLSRWLGGEYVIPGGEAGPDADDGIPDADGTAETSTSRGS